MSNRFLPSARVAAWVGLAVTGACGLAQTLSPYQPGCREVLQLTAGRFSELYRQKNADDSEAGQDQAAITWANCKYDANLARLQHFPKLKARLVSLPKLEGTFIRAETDLADAQSGGGTVYGHEEARFQPTMQLHLERLIALTTSKSGSAQSASIAAKCAAARSTLEARLKRVLKTPQPFVDGRTPSEKTTARPFWLESARAYSSAYGRVQGLIGSTVDAVSLGEMQFLNDGLWAEEL